MKTDARRATRIGTVFRVVLRTLGVIAALVFVAGACLVHTEVPDFFGVRSLADAREQAVPILGGSFGKLALAGLWMLVSATAVLLLWGLVELVSGLFLVAGRKSAAGLGNTVQVVLAIAVLVVVNAVAYQWYWREDCTRDKRFTLDKELIESLKQLDLNTPTTIVVLQMGKTSALDQATKPDALTTAAQTKITEKVLDLIDELRQNREVGSRFDVHVLNSSEEGFAEQLKKIAPDQGELKNPLRTAVEGANENSIFFAANNRVRRMPFSQFYLLDKVSSTDQANLVLHPQGKDRFVRALVGLETRKPKVALAVIHPLLSSRNEADDYTALGLRKTLEEAGFEVGDVILKKWSGPQSPGGPPPAAFSFEETEFSKVEGQFNMYSMLAMNREQAVAIMKSERDRLAKAPLETVNKELGRALGRPVKTEADRAELLKEVLDYSIEVRANELNQYRAARDKAKPDYERLLANDRMLEARRNANVKQKFAAAVADADMLIIPRHTVMDVVRGGAIPPALYKLSTEQVEVAREFIAAGKPVLFGFGPTNVENRRGPQDDTPDEMEQLLARFGIELGTQTVLSDKDAQQMGERRGDEDQLQGDPEVSELFIPAGSNNPIAQGYTQWVRSLGNTVSLRKGGSRPIQLAKWVKQPTSTTVLETGTDTWNEAKPFADQNTIPTFDPPKPSDPKRGTREEERRGPFTVGVAIEARVPSEWKDVKNAGPLASAIIGGAGMTGPGLPMSLSLAALTPEDDKAKTVRLAVFGHGGLFVGNKLKPAQEALLLSTVNWQLKRDDALPKADAGEWTYPRAALNPQQKSYWGLVAFPGLPLLMAVLGLLMWMIRRPR
jgi:hypothetical protein